VSRDSLAPDQRRANLCLLKINYKSEKFSRTQWMQVLKIFARLRFAIWLTTGWQNMKWKHSRSRQTDCWTKTNISPMLRWSFVGRAERFGESYTSRGDDGKELLARRQFARGATTILFFNSQGQTSNPKNDKSVKERRVYIFKYWGESNWFNKTNLPRSICCTRCIFLIFLVGFLFSGIINTQ